MPPQSIADSTRRAIARDVLLRESASVAALVGRLDERFDTAVDLILRARGRVIVTGMGKSGLIGQKVAATLSSTGTPAFFLHPVEAGHGDVGVLTQDDIVVAISKSGITDEIGELLPVFKRMGVPIILISGNPSGELARRSDVVLDASVDGEAEVNDLVPTCSTTAALALGDALAIALMSERGVTPEDFARFHPRGALGRRLLFTVADLMHSGEHMPLVNEQASFKELLLEMTRKRLGCSGIVDAGGKLTGIFTDGDLRRRIESRGDLFSLSAREVMTRSPITSSATDPAVAALTKMEDSKITVLFIVDEAGAPVGVLHMHDVISSGAV